jgi:hypothetical protein
MSTAASVSVSVPIWLTLTSSELPQPFRSPRPDGGVGDEQIVAHQLDLVAQTVGQQFPAVPVIFGTAVLDADRIG